MTKRFFIILSVLILSVGSVGCYLAAEKWTLVKLITSGQDVEVIGDVALVRYCTSTAEVKTVDCSAGTSRDLTIGQYVESGGSLGAVIAEGNFGIGVEVSSSLGFSRGSGETLSLPPPPNAGLIYRYPVEKTYHTYVGQALATSSRGEEVEVSYTFNASCSLRLGEPQVTTCDGIPIEDGYEALIPKPETTPHELATNTPTEPATVPPLPTQTTAPTNTPTKPAIALPRPTQTTVPTNTPVPQPVVEQLDPIIVSGFSQQGSTFTAPDSGRYHFKIIGGPYSPWPDESYEGYRGWLTQLSIYENKPVVIGPTQYGYRGPVDADNTIGWGEYQVSTEQAMADARRRIDYSVYLNAGEYVTFVPIDEEGAYGDNRGDIVLSVLFTKS